jgi:hypothetical protein
LALPAPPEAFVGATKFSFPYHLRALDTCFSESNPEPISDHRQYGIPAIAAACATERSPSG